MNMESRKRQRSENWLEEDKILLKEMVKERVCILENKNTDSNTNYKKVAAWQDLLASFNAMAKAKRTMKQIKSQWCIMKMSAKKMDFKHRKEVLRTGGGPPPPIESPSGDDIAVWLPNEFFVDSNEFDSDSQKLPKMEVLSMEKQTEEQKIAIPEPEPSTSSKFADISGPNIEDTISEPGPSTSATVTIADMSGTYTADTILESTKPAKKKLRTAKNAKVSSITPAAQRICDAEIACRRELHEAQMVNEQQKLKNLKLKEELLKLKIIYYRSKTE